MKKISVKNTLLSIILPVSVVILILAVWQAVVVVKSIPAWQMPKPTEILSVMVLGIGELLPNILYTYTNVVIGFLLAITIGFFLGIAITSNKMAGIILTPYINLLCMIPLITIVPLLMLWMGFGRNVKIITIIIQSFPIMNLNCCIAFANVDSVRLELMDSLKATRVQKYMHCIIPSAVPGIFTGIKLASILSVLACVNAEMTGGNNGLGACINNYVAYMKMPQAFACIFFIMILGLIMYGIVSMIETKLLSKR
mgnify:CR=1 FL=1